VATVFVSHRSADGNLAESLAVTLRNRGHTVWLDRWELNVGESIVARIDDGLSDAVFLVLCYSGIGSLSPWMSREWMSALARQLSGAQVRLIPVRLSGGAPPAILG
jgi:hypothetical protein